jgi:hypothetical protein
LDILRFRARSATPLLAPLVAILIFGISWAVQAAPQEGNPGLSGRVGALEAVNAEQEATFDALKATDNALGARIDALEAFVRKLHRQSAAVVEFDTGGSSSQIFDRLMVKLDFCTQEEYEFNTVMVAS